MTANHRGKFRDRMLKIFLSKKNKETKKDDNIETKKKGKDIKYKYNDFFKNVQKLKETEKEYKIKYRAKGIFVGKIKKESLKKVQDLEKKYKLVFSSKVIDPSKEKIENKSDNNYLFSFSKKGEGNTFRNINNFEDLILEKIKSELQRQIDSLEVLESDTYILNKEAEEIKSKEECEQVKKKIGDLIKKINKIKEEYNILKSKNLDIDYIELGNMSLVELIEDYKYLTEDSFFFNKLKKNYKKLNLFTEVSDFIEFVDLEIKNIDKDTKKLSDKLGISEEKMYKLKESMYNIDEKVDKYNLYINNQLKIISDLDSIVGKIDANERIKTIKVGYEGLLSNNLKYIALLMLSPLKGIFPSIALSTMATKQTLDMIYKRAHIEQVKEVYYNARDYGEQIKGRIYSISDMKNLVEISLAEVRQIKKDFKNEIINNQSLEYSRLLNKIEDIEKALISNANKMNFMEKRLLEQKRLNENSLKKVKKLNDNN